MDTVVNRRKKTAKIKDERFSTLTTSWKRSSYESLESCFLPLLCVPHTMVEERESTVPFRKLMYVLRTVSGAVLGISAQDTKKGRVFGCGRSPSSD